MDSTKCIKRGPEIERSYQSIPAFILKSAYFKGTMIILNLTLRRDGCWWIDHVDQCFQSFTPLLSWSDVFSSQRFDVRLLRFHEREPPWHLKLCTRLWDGNFGTGRSQDQCNCSCSAQRLLRKIMENETQKLKICSVEKAVLKVCSIAGHGRGARIFPVVVKLGK